MRTLFKSMTLVVAILLCALLSKAQVRISEISGDTGNNDAENDALVEISAPAGTDIGCYVISNSEWVVVLPTGTKIPADGHFIIACGQAQIANNPSPNSGLTCPECDFEGLPLDFDVCNPANSQYVDFAATGFTLDNTTADDGDQVVLFSPDGKIADAVQWGNGSRFLATDNTTVAPNTAGSVGRGGGNKAYTLGDPTWNTEGNAALLPAALKAGGSCYQANVLYTMPPISGGLYCNLTPLVATKTINADILKGCNSTFQRIGTGCAATDWKKSDHPNPGLPNNSLADMFEITGNTTQCSAAITPITFTWKILNWQKVETQIKSTLYKKIGSFVSTDNGTTRLPWQVNKDLVTGITTLTYTFTPTANANYHLVWKDYTDSPIAASDNGSNSGKSVTKNTTISDCYESKIVKIQVINPLVATKTNIVCPVDFTAGMVNISTLVNGSGALKYELFDGTTIAETNNSGLFLLSTALTGSLTVKISDASNCTTPITINIDNNCKKIPVCPSAIVNTGSTPTGAVCPDDIIKLCANGTDLPKGGAIEWFVGDNTNFNPYNANEGKLIGKVSVPTADGTTGHPDGGTCPVITGIMVDACNGTGLEADNEFIVLRNGAAALNVNDLAINLPNNIDITVANTNDFSANSGINPTGGCYTTLDDGAVIPADALAIIFTSNHVTQTYDFNSLCAAYGNVYLLFKNQAPTNGTFTNTKDASRAVTVSVNNKIACTAKYTYTNPILTIDGTYYAMPLPVAGESATNVTSNNGCASPPIATKTPPCFDYTIPIDACNTTQHFKAIVNPIASTCNQANATSAVLSYSVACPDAVLSGGGIACSPKKVPLSIDFKNVTGNPTFTITYTIDGVAQIPITTTTNPYILNAAVSGEYQIQEVSVSGNCKAKFSGISNAQIIPLSNINLVSENITTCPNSIIPLKLTSTGEFPMTISYSVNSINASKTLTSNTLYLETQNLVAGTYTIKLLSVSDENDCIGSVGTTTSTIIIRSKPTFTAESTQITCNGTIANSDGSLLIKNFDASHHYSYTLGNTYTGTSKYSTATAIPAGGVLVNNLTNPSVESYYTIRVFSVDDCFEEKTVILKNKVCKCVDGCLEVKHSIIRK